MIKTAEYPSIFHQKVLAREAPGGAAARLDVVVPTIAKPGRPLTVKVAVLDEKGYPSLASAGAVKLELPGGKLEETALTFQAGVPAVGCLKEIVIPNEGLFRLRASVGRLEAYSNPIWCVARDVPGVYWGDPHVHTALSNCHPQSCRSLNFCFTMARHVSGLDWLAVTDHISNGRGELAKWKEQTAAAELYHDEPAFVTLPAFECSLRGGSGGDNNVYMARFPDMFVDEYETGNTRTLCAKMKEKLSDQEFFIAPHHTTRSNKHGEVPDEIYPGPQAMPVIEVHSKWGTSEYRGNPHPLMQFGKQGIHPGPSYVVDFLNRGIPFGFVAGTDSHASMPSGGGDEPKHLYALPGITAVRSEGLSRQSVFDAIRHKRCYAASGERILLHGTMAGKDFGQSVRLAELSGGPQVDVQVAGKSDITQIELVRNGQTIHTVTPGTWQHRLVHRDQQPLAGLMLTSPHAAKFVYYYLRVTCQSGAQAWSSPVWVYG